MCIDRDVLYSKREVTLWWRHRNIFSELFYFWVYNIIFKIFTETMYFQISFVNLGDVIMTSSKWRFLKIHIRQVPIVMKLGGYVEYNATMTNLKWRQDDVILLYYELFYIYYFLLIANSGTFINQIDFIFGTHRVPSAHLCRTLTSSLHYHVSRDITLLVQIRLCLYINKDVLWVNI